MRLPLLKPIQGVTKGAAAVEKPASVPTTLDGIKVLVVDDNIDNLTLFSVILKSFGAKVTLAESAAKGLKALSEHRPDIVLSDVSMPEEDGFAFIQKIRMLDEKSGCKTPVVALTAYAGADDVRRMLDAGFTAHVAKPVERTFLSKVIARLISQSKNI